MQAVGFEPTRVSTLELESNALDRSATLALVRVHAPHATYAPVRSIKPRSIIKSATMEAKATDEQVKSRKDTTEEPKETPEHKSTQPKETNDEKDDSVSETKTVDTDVKSEVAVTSAARVKPSSFFTFKKLLILYAVLYVGRSLYKTVYKPRDATKTYYPNAAAPNTPFNVTFYLKDKYRRTQRIIGENSDMRYSLDASNAYKFNVTLSEDEFTNLEYLSIIPAVTFTNQLTNKQESVYCESELSEELEERKVDAEGSMKGVVEKHTKGEKSAHLRTNLFFHLVVDENERTPDEDPILNYMYFRRQAVPSAYSPYLDCSQYWVLRRDKKPVRLLPDGKPVITVAFDTYWWYKFTWVTNFHIAERQTNSLLHDSSAFDEIKNILSDNSYSYLTVLFSVNLLHSLFSFLSVKNKVSFWKKVSSTEGISRRQYYLDFIFQIVIVLYLIDNEASFILIALTIVETLVSLWVAARLLQFEKRPDGKFPYYQLKREQLTAEEEQTVEYDRQATRFMSMVLMPILLGYSIYSFYYRGQISMYSFLLKTLVSFIYAIGFINMTPQIYINYKFKSVERMPWKAMIYQFLNTIVDDLFAFAVKMPTLQRISVFRDDVVFVIYLYQYWIYRKNKGVQAVNKKEE